MADFIIKPGRTIWCHQRSWLPGQEEALDEAGFSEEQKATKVRTGVIEWTPAAAPAEGFEEDPGDSTPVDATPEEKTPEPGGQTSTDPGGDDTPEEPEGEPEDESPADDAASGEAPANDDGEAGGDDSGGGEETSSSEEDEGKSSSDGAGDPPSEPEINISNAAAVFAREHGLDLTGATGTGKGGRITMNDVRKLKQ